MEILKVLTVISTMVCLSGTNGMNEKNESAQIPIKDELQDVNEKLFFGDETRIGDNSWTAQEMIFALNEIVKYQRGLAQRFSEKRKEKSEKGGEISAARSTSLSLRFISLVQDSPTENDSLFTRTFCDNPFVRYLLDRGYYLRIRCKDGVDRLTPTYNFSECGMRGLYEKFYLNYISNYMLKFHSLHKSDYTNGGMLMYIGDLFKKKSEYHGYETEEISNAMRLSLRYRPEEFIHFSLKFVEDPFVLFLRSWRYFDWRDYPGTNIQFLVPVGYITRDQLEELYAEFKREGFDNFTDLLESSDVHKRERACEMSRSLKVGKDSAELLKNSDELKNLQ